MVSGAGRHPFVLPSARIATVRCQMFENERKSIVNGRLLSIGTRVFVSGQREELPELYVSQCVLISRSRECMDNSCRLLVSVVPPFICTNNSSAPRSREPPKTDIPSVGATCLIANQPSARVWPSGERAIQINFPTHHLVGLWSEWNAGRLLCAGGQDEGCARLSWSSRRGVGSWCEAFANFA